MGGMESAVAFMDEARYGMAQAAGLVARAVADTWVDDAAAHYEAAREELAAHLAVLATRITEARIAVVGCSVEEAAVLRILAGA